MMRPLVSPQGEYPRVFSEWGISVTLVKGSDGTIYFPVRQLCTELGIDADRQIVRLNADEELSPGLVEIPVSTKGGTQRSVCIRRKEAAWWLATMDEKRCKPAIKGHLQMIKHTLMDAADRLIFGDIMHASEGGRGVLVISSRDEYVIACLDCGARHRVVIVNGEASVTLEREG